MDEQYFNTNTYHLFHIIFQQILSNIDIAITLCYFYPYIIRLSIQKQRLLIVIERNPYTVREQVRHHVQVLQSVAMEVFHDEEL